MTFKIIGVDDATPEEAIDTGITENRTTITNTKIYNGTDMILTGELTASNLDSPDLTCVNLTASDQVSCADVDSGDTTCNNITATGNGVCNTLILTGDLEITGGLTCFDIVSYNVACEDVITSGYMACGNIQGANADTNSNLQLNDSLTVNGDTAFTGKMGQGAHSFGYLHGDHTLTLDRLYSGFSTGNVGLHAYLYLKIPDGKILGQQVWCMLEHKDAGEGFVEIKPDNFFDGDRFQLTEERDRCQLIWSNDGKWHLLYNVGILTYPT